MATTQRSFRTGLSACLANSWKTKLITLLLDYVETDRAEPRVEQNCWAL